MVEGNVTLMSPLSDVDQRYENPNKRRQYRHTTFKTYYHTMTCKEGLRVPKSNFVYSGGNCTFSIVCSKNIRP